MVVAQAILGTDVRAETASDESVRFREARAYYEKGWAGDDAALLKAVELLDALVRSPTASPEVRACWGSACIARARLAPDWRKRVWLERGAKALDAAVAEAARDVRVRLFRAASFAILPRLAGKSDVVEADFAWLRSRAESMPPTDPVRQEIFYRAGAFALRNRDPRAVVWLEEAARAGELNGISGERIARMLRLARRSFVADGEPAPISE